MSGELIKVGKYDLKYNKILDIDIAELDIYRSTGLPAHMVKRKHFNCLKYIDIAPLFLTSRQVKHSLNTFLQTLWTCPFH